MVLSRISTYLCSATNINNHQTMLTKGGILMCVINVFTSFVSNGAKTLHDAALGQYDHESEGVSEIRAEMFESDSSDAERVRQDWHMLGRDARIAVEKFAVGHE